MLKLPQMIQLGNCGLILSHSFDSGITTAFLYGCNVLSDSNFEVNVAVEPFITNIRKLLRTVEPSTTLAGDHTQGTSDSSISIQEHCSLARNHQTPSIIGGDEVWPSKTISIRACFQGHEAY